MLFDNAAAKGADCHDKTRVMDVLLDGDRAKGVRVRTADGKLHEIAARVIVDATGQHSFLANRLGLRVDNPRLKKASIWSYYRGARRDEGELPVERINELWKGNSQEMFGESLTVGDDYAWWWLYIPHIIHTPFYVYAYAFGELLVLSLYARYQKQGEDFIPDYLALLAAGGSKSPAAICENAGIDITQREFWQGGMDLLRAMVAQARELAGA